MSELRYAIIGSGGIGGFYGAMLAKAGCAVDFLFHSDYEYVVANGLRVDSVLGDFHLPQVSAYRSTQEMPVADVVLVCLKSTNNHLLKDLLPPLLKPDTLVVLIQNGLGLEEDLLQDFPGLHLAAGLAFICSQKSGPGHVSHLDYGKLTLSPFQAEGLSMVEQLLADLESAGVEAELAADLESARWKKLVWNIPYNGSTVVLDTSTEQLMANPDSAGLMEDLMKEVQAGAAACGVKYPIDDAFVATMLEMTRKMTPYSPSMKLDYDNGRPLEIDYIYTRPIQRARAAGVRLPKIEMLEAQLRFLKP